MLRIASRTTRKTRSARFLTPQRDKGCSRAQFLPLALLPNLSRLAEVCKLFGLSYSFKLLANEIDSAQSVDQLISQFLEEVNDHHFPVNTEYWSDDETLRHPALQGRIPVRPKGFDSWHYDDPITLLMTLAGLEDDPCPALDALACDYPQLYIPLGFKLSDIPPVLTRMDLSEPLGELPDLIRMVTRRTGTFFLDHSPAEYDFYENRGAGIQWSAHNVSWLKADWEIAKPIHERAWKLINWTMTKQEERTAVLIQIILSAHERITS